jgi:tyrosine-specific transport protein
MTNSFVLALSTLVGTIIGAGIFGVPYVFSQSGFFVGTLHIVVVGIVVTLLHLFFGEIALRTKAKHRLIGYAELYVGSFAKKLVVFSTFFGIVGSLLAYIIVAGTFLQLALSPVVSWSPEVFSLGFWAVLSLFVFVGMQAIARLELFMNIALFAVLFILFTSAAPHVSVGNISVFSFSHILLPWGVVFFALAGWAAIPELADFFKKSKDKKKLDNVIVVAGVFTSVLFLLFSFFIVGVTGKNTTPDALTGLVPFLGPWVVTLGALFGLVAIAASFLILGNYLKNSLRYDFKLSYVLSSGIAIFAPVFFFLLGFREFIVVLGIVGAVLGAIEGVVIVLAFVQAKKKGDRKPEYELHIPLVLIWLIITLLVVGAAAELLL